LKNGDTDLKETEWDGVDWKHLAQDRAIVKGTENLLLREEILKQGFAE
jgi:hypothetical protein